MRIALYCQRFLPNVGGREVVVYQLGRALAARGHEVRILGPAGIMSARGLDYGVPVHRYPRVTLRRPLTDRFEQMVVETQLSAQLCFDLALRGRVDVIHAHSLYPAAYVATRLRRLGSTIPLVSTPHGIDINVVPEQHYGMRLDPGLRRKIDIALTGSAAVTAISAGVRETLRSAGVSGDRLVEISNGVDPDRFSGKPVTDVRSRYGLPRGARLILTVGNYTPLKGHEDLIQAMPGIIARVPDAYLIIAGRGTEPLAQLARALGIHDRLILTGSIPMPRFDVGKAPSDDLLRDIYLSSDLYVSASNREGAEGLSLSLLDAMAAGLPSVGTDIVGNRDVIRHGVNGYLVPPLDTAALIEAIAASILRVCVSTQMSLQARKTVASYSWDAVAARYEQVYESVLTGATGT